MTIKTSHLVIAAIIILIVFIFGGSFLSNLMGKYKSDIKSAKAEAKEWREKAEASQKEAKKLKEEANVTFTEAVELSNTEIIKTKYVKVHVDINSADMPEFDSILSAQISQNSSH